MMDRTLKALSLMLAGEGGEIFIGRNASNGVHLPDLAVEQTHVRIDVQGDGTLVVAALGTAIAAVVAGRS